MVKITLTIRDELRERMNPFNSQVNWSAIASQAFENEVEWRSKLEMNPTIARLMKSKKEHEALAAGEAKDFASAWIRGGTDDSGQAWGAEYSQLLKLETLATSQEWTEGQYFHGEPMAPHTWGTLVCESIGVDDPEYIFGDMVNDNREKFDDPEFLEAFVQAAYEVWQEVKREADGKL